MTSVKRLLLILVLVALLAPLGSASGNLGPVRGFMGGGVVAPDHPHQSIRLDSEEVTIRLQPSSYVVDAVFDLINTGETTTEWTGFPKWVVYSGYRDGSTFNSNFLRFDAWVDGRHVAFSEGQDIAGSRGFLTAPKSSKSWLVGQVTFPGHSKTTIRVSYEAPYHARQLAFYTYGTGSLWKDNIGKAVFIIDASQVGGTKQISTDFNVKVDSKLISDDVVQYELTDFKPLPEAYVRVHIFRYPGAPPPPLPVRIKK